MFRPTAWILDIWGVTTLDLSNLSQLGVLPPQGKYAILDLGHTQSNFVILEGNQLKAVRCFSWGGFHLTQAIAKVANISYDQAEEYKKSKGQVVEKSEDPSLKIIEECVQDLLQQLRQTLFAFHESGERAVEALYLSGGSSKLMGLDSYFSNRLKINVNSLDVLEGPYAEFPNAEKCRSIIPTALGSALRAVFPNKSVKINFRRGDYAYKKDIEQLGGTLKRLGVVAAAVVILGLTHFVIRHMSLSSQVEKMNTNITKLVKATVKGLPKKGIKSSKSALSILTGKISAIDEKLKKVQWEEGSSSLSILKTISASMPPRDQLSVDIDDITITADRVRLEGRTTSYEGIDKVKAAMEKVKNFKNVQTGNVRKGVREQIKFSLSFDLST